ncbi:hypothetical protein BAUCODRAFT_509176 [Baudoinia panamericana UAMH 10762]|uniref:Uncharacterized protein n=1 Tax=Baudoinia panamericana (strain UAMH 10762) TaxID=717646 RepID=M2MH20_BAUPA|nr:uncharacterized protein BAUCODRAFT_509176 [Baudoinia panamericana UAMH 10762]EMC95921.1 hypothetical protein BAUCODRAFT_509176 [Baudoinia panamericana UAMH 10762]
MSNPAEPTSTEQPESGFTNLHRHVWQLLHLVKTTSCQLSACLSLNSLLRNTVIQQRYDRADTYLVERQCILDALPRQIRMMNELRQSMPDAMPSYPYDRREREAYSAWLLCVMMLGPVTGILERLDASEEMLFFSYLEDRRMLLRGLADGVDLRWLEELQGCLKRGYQRGGCER